MTTLTQNQKAVINILEVSTLEQADAKLQVRGMKLPNKITKHFIDTLLSDINNDNRDYFREYKKHEFNMQLFLQELVKDVLADNSLKELRDNTILLDYTNKNGKLIKDVRFLSFESKKMVQRKSIYEGTSAMRTQNFPYVGEVKRVKRFNLDGGEFPVNIHPNQMNTNDLKVRIAYKGKQHVVSIKRLSKNGVSLIKLMNKAGTQEKELVQRVNDKQSVYNQKSETMFYHQAYGLGQLVPLSVENGTPLYFQNDEYGHQVAVFMPSKESEGLSTLSFNMEDNDNNGMAYGEGETQSSESLSSAYDASQLRQVYAKELMAFGECDHEEIMEFDKSLVAKIKDIMDNPNPEHLYYAMSMSVGDVDERTKQPTITYMTESLPEMVYVVANLPARVYNVGKTVKKAPQVLALGEESGRIYITSPSKLYKLNGAENASYRDLRYKWVNPENGEAFVDSTDGITVESSDEEDDFYTGKNLESSVPTKNVTLKPEHIEKHKLTVPKVNYDFELKYVPVTDGAHLATMKFKTGTVSHWIKFNYSAETKSLVPTTSFKVSNEKSQENVNAFTQIAQRIWTAKRPVQKQQVN